MDIIKDIVLSKGAPSNKNVGWLKPVGNKLELNFYSSNGWTSVSGGGSYTLPIASPTLLGGVKIGKGITINPTTGVISVDDTKIITKIVNTIAERDALVADEGTICIVKQSTGTLETIPSSYIKVNTLWYNILNIPKASKTTAGISKIYDSLGTNKDGAIDQYTVTQEISKIKPITLKDWRK